MHRFGVVFDRLFARHDTGFGHPERPGRLDPVEAALEHAHAFAASARIAPTPIDTELVTRVHTTEYIARVEQACREGRPSIDEEDCAICPESFEIARLGAGAVVEAASRIAADEIEKAFCAVRPPGHHAERDRSMGFCLLANVALAAEAVRARFGLTRILILDWDVHHGNGTQHIFEADPGVLFISLHGHPDTLYPGTGYAHETGTGPGEGYTLNLPMSPGATDVAYRRAFEQSIEPRVAEFEPEFVIISAGFDAHRDDPLGNLALTDDAYAWMTSRAVAMARGSAKGRLLSVLEGGYNLQVLRRCVEEHVRILEQAS
ncbi:MAG: acetoin utilization protein [Planctomycetota bacterium]